MSTAVTDLAESFAGMAPDDVYSLREIGSPHVSPDGSLVAYQVTTIDREANEYRSAVWVVPFDGARPAKQFTTGEAVDGSPRWSPDGRYLAFTSNRGGRPPQLYVMPASGGEACRLTDLPEAVAEIVWSPDATQIGFTSRVRDKTYDETDERRREPRRITRLMFKVDSVGFTTDRRKHIFVVDADGGEPIQITDGDAEDASPEWTPEGDGLVFTSMRGDRWDVELCSRLYQIDATGDRMECLTGDEGSYSAPRFSPDGRWLAYQFVPFDGTAPHHTQVGVMDWESPSRERRLLTTALDRHCGPYSYGVGVWWSDGHVMHGVDDHGNVHVYRAATDGSTAPEIVVGGEISVSASHVSAGSLVYVASTYDQPTRLFAGDGRELPIETSANAHTFVAAERFTASSQDDAQVDAWLVRPANFNDNKKYPTVLLIHGGPFAQFGSAFLDEVQVLARAGYAVIFANPRGSSGDTEAWGRAIRGPGGYAGPGWGTVDYEDFMNVVDVALRSFSFLDPARLAVFGGSYGGYMTSWLISHTNIFKAAISERAVNNLFTCFGSSDLFWAAERQVGVLPWCRPRGMVETIAHDLRRPDRDPAADNSLGTRSARRSRTGGESIYDPPPARQKSGTTPIPGRGSRVIPLGFTGASSPALRSDPRMV